MRYHLFKSSSTNYLIIADSQVRHLSAGNFNILCVPGALIHNFYDFLPPPEKYDIIVLFVGGNNCYEPKKESAIPAVKIANDLSELAINLKKRCKKVFVIGIPRGTTSYQGQKK